MYETPAEARATAERCRRAAESRGDANLAARALVLSCAVEMHCGNFTAADELMARAIAAAGTGPAPRAAADLAAISAQLALSAEDYDGAAESARRAIALSDASGDLAVQIRARRIACGVYGNLRLPELRAGVEEQLALAVMSDELWEEAMSRNDLACLLLDEGDLAGAEEQIDRAMRLLGREGGGHRYTVAVLLATRADVRLAGGRCEEGLADAEQSLRSLLAGAEPDPYVVAAAVRAQVQALASLGRAEEARAAGLAALERIGDRVPYMRNRVLEQIDDAAAAAGSDTTTDARTDSRADDRD